jgi:serine/threonine-protein kinase
MGRADLAERRAPAPEEVRAQLEKLLASRPFRRSARMCRFLRLAVEHALAGDSDPLKEYRVGVEVFDRKPDYDPRIDPIVRVEARRLRAKLKAYYASTGKTDGVIVEFPKGAYVPTFRVRGAGRTAPRKETGSSIAVLPFANLTPDAADDYFSDGLAEELNLLLTRVEGLRVVAWHSAAQLRGWDRDLKSIREKLKVGFVLKGAVRRTTDQVRVTAQLIDTASGAVLWSEGYNRTLRGVFAIQEEIARAIVQTLPGALGTAAPASPVRAVPNLDCYNLCLQGRFNSNKRTRQGLESSARCYTEAVEKDPNCSMAYAGLADAYSLLSDYGVMHPREAIPKAEAAALRALELDSQSADALASLAFIRSMYHWRWEEAEGLYRRAIAINPNNAKARHWFGIDHLAQLGRFEESLEQIQAARMLDPLSLNVHEGHAYLALLRRDYEGALATLRQMIEFDPRFYKAYSTMGRVYSLAGRYEDAIASFEKAQALGGAGSSLVAAMGQTRAAAGDRDAGYRALEELQRMSLRGFVPCTSYGILYMGLGEFGPSLDWLERAVDQHEFQAGSFFIHPLYDPIRSEERFQRLLHRVGFLP